jgi:hypothetical protein
VTTLFLDTEFNGLHGELISMALVSADGRVFYEVLDTSEMDIDLFVAEHVLPKLDQEPVTYLELCRVLVAFLRQFSDVEVVADWPADFEHLCRAMTQGAVSTGKWDVLVELSMRLVTTPKLSPTRPHNAVSDAIALRDWWLGPNRDDA